MAPLGAPRCPADASALTVAAAAEEEASQLEQMLLEEGEDVDAVAGAGWEEAAASSPGSSPRSAREASSAAGGGVGGASSARGWAAGADGAGPWRRWPALSLRLAAPALGLLAVVVLWSGSWTADGRWRSRLSRSPSLSSRSGARDEVDMEEVVSLADFPKPPSLFCFSVMRRGSSEEDLVRAQLRDRSSIFACDAFAVLSGEKFSLGELNGQEVLTWEIPMPVLNTTDQVMNGQVKRSYLNAQTFIVAWDALLLEGDLVWSHDWAVKVDPDTVFFPDRLRLHVSPHQGASLYLLNCQPAESKVPQLFGSLEVYSVEAIKNYGSNKERCKSSLDWHGSSENSYMQACMDLLGVGRKFDSSLLADPRCEPSACGDWTRVSFHPYKDTASYVSCYKEATQELLR